MKNNCIVRILTTELWHFKNIGYGKIDYSGCHSARWNAAVSEQDITGLYGQNGSGKTALIEAMDIVRFILMGREIPYEEYAGLIGVEENTVISAEFFVATGYGRKYKATYEVSLKAVKDKKRILLVSEKLLFRKWMSSWSAKSSLLITGVHRVTEERCDSGVIPEKKTVVVRAKPVLYAERTGLDQCFRNVAGYCVQKNVSIFFNRLMLNAKRGKTHDGGFADVITSLNEFGRNCLQIVKIGRLGGADCDYLPAGRNGTTDDAFARLIRDGKTDLSGSTYMRIRKIVGRLNEILPAVIPGLTLELTINSGEKYTAGKQVVCAELYSKREEKCFLMKYESDGTRRILFLLRYLIDLCCMSELCVFVDSLDSEIFEYLFGSLLAVMRGEIRGQLIFTSHNLHAMDELPRKDIVFTTLNPDNRYVRITGLEKKTGLREQYLQMNSLGSQ